MSSWPVIKFTLFFTLAHGHGDAATTASLKTGVGDAGARGLPAHRNLSWWFSSDAARREQRACVFGGGERVLSRDSDARCCCCRVGHRRAPAPDPAQREHPHTTTTTTTSTSKQEQQQHRAQPAPFLRGEQDGTEEDKNITKIGDALFARSSHRRAGSIEQGRLSHRVCGAHSTGVCARGRGGCVEGG